jgi:hypothetical protein
MINNSGRSDGVRPGGRAATISAQAALDVKVTNMSGQPNFLQILCNLGISGTNSEGFQ